MPISEGKLVGISGSAESAGAAAASSVVEKRATRDLPCAAGALKEDTPPTRARAAVATIERRMVDIIFDEGWCENG